MSSMRKWAAGCYYHPSTDLILITGDARLSIETLVNIHYLRKNNIGLTQVILE